MGISKKAKIVLASMTIALVGTPFLIVRAIDGESERLMATAQKELKAMGYPVTVAELKSLAPPANENAALLYQPIYEELRKAKFKTPDSRSLPDAAETAFLDQNLALFDRLDAAAQRPSYWFDRKYEEGMNTLFPELAYMKELARWTGRRALLESTRGDTRSAMRRLEAMTTMAEHLSQEPILIGGLVSTAIFKIRDSAALRTSSLSSDLTFRKRAKDLVTSRPARFDMSRHIGAEAAIFSVDQPIPVDPYHEDTGWLGTAQKTTLVAKRFRGMGLELLAKTARASQDGLTATELDALLDFENEQRYRDLISTITPVSFSVPDSATITSLPGYNETLATAFDVSIELAGGPKAKLPAGTRVERKGESWAVISPTHYFSMHQKQLSSSRPSFWRGFTP